MTQDPDVTAQEDETGERAASLSLAPVLDLAAAKPLADAILEASEGDVTLDAGEVRRLGGQCLQILLAARASYAARGRELRIDPCSDAFVDDLSLYGLTPETFATSGL